MEKKKNYKCALCNKEYETIAERAKCETACVDKQLAIEEKAKKEQAKQEQEAERQKVMAAINYAGELLDAYTDKYGSFSYSSVDMCAAAENVESPKTEPVATTKTTSKIDTKAKEPWPFDNWPFSSKLFSFFW